MFCRRCHLLLLISLPFLFGTSLATCKFKSIHNASELVEFSNEVNSGKDYTGYTVYFTADIEFNKDLSQQFEPIGHYSGSNDWHYFSGTFDGQGYVISNLEISSSSLRDVGLFGTSEGITIKNVVLDNTCSVSSSFMPSAAIFTPFVGGVIGDCSPTYEPCIIKNNVNMASVSYSGNAFNNLYLGGIIADFYVSSDNIYESKIVNCVNYGTIHNSGNAPSSIFIGGIIGDINVKAENYNVNMYNCFNYGTVKNTGSATKHYYLGGLVGASSETSIKKESWNNHNQ